MFEFIILSCTEQLQVVADIELVFGFWTTFGNLAEDTSRTDIIVLLQVRVAASAV